jgi:hypothetical protein
LPVVAITEGVKNAPEKLPQVSQGEPLFAPTNFAIFSHITGQNLSFCHRKHSFDGGKVWWVGIGEPLANSAARKRDRGAGKREGIGGVNCCGQFIKKVIVFS